MLFCHCGDADERASLQWTQMPVSRQFDVESHDKPWCMVYIEAAVPEARQKPARGHVTECEWQPGRRWLHTAIAHSQPASSLLLFFVALQTSAASPRLTQPISLRTQSEIAIMLKALLISCNLCRRRTRKLMTERAIVTHND